MPSTPRRSFIGALAAAAAAVSLPSRASRVFAAQMDGGHEAWLSDVKGGHKCLFDFPGHNMGFGLVHIFNYVSTYSAAYGAGAGQVGTVGTFYGMGPGSSIAMGFNDAMWVKYGISEYLGLEDAHGAAYTRNVFNRPTAADSHILEAVIKSPTLPLFQELFVACGIENLQKLGTKFIMCNNALGGWAAELDVRGKGDAAAIDADLRANLLPGVTIVPAMVIAIEKAQEAGFAYNRQ